MQSSISLALKLIKLHGRQKNQKFHKNGKNRLDNLKKALMSSNHVMTPYLI